MGLDNHSTMLRLRTFPHWRADKQFKNKTKANHTYTRANVGKHSEEMYTCNICYRLRGWNFLFWEKRLHNTETNTPDQNHSTLSTVHEAVPLQVWHTYHSASSELLLPLEWWYTSAHLGLPGSVFENRNMNWVSDTCFLHYTYIMRFTLCL